jgi:hypothetical protein
MGTRLVETYEIGAGVEVRLRSSRWFYARVIGHEHPGVWVQDDLGRQWYVTNARHIRRKRNES